MLYENDAEIAREKMRAAETALETYLRTGRYDPERHAQLALAVRAARDQFVEIFIARFSTLVQGQRRWPVDDWLEAAGS